jgi:cell division protein FtsN
MKQQRGGTLLGFIFGLILGLGVALAVAVYVTKVPIPFLNKGLNRTAEQDAAEEKKNKDWDPNAPLYGKNPVKPPEKPEKEEDPKAVVPNPILSPPAVSGTPADDKADPLGDLARARAGAADPFNYYVQAGAFRTPEDAEVQRAKLALAGFDPRVSEREQSGRTVYRVRIGPLESKDEAERIQQKLTATKVESALVRVQR